MNNKFVYRQAQKINVERLKRVIQDGNAEAKLKIAQIQYYVFNVVNNVIPKTKWKARGFFAMLLLGATTACKVRDIAHNNLNFWDLFWRKSRDHPWLIDSYYNFVTENKWYGPVAKTSNGALKIRSAGAIMGAGFGFAAGMLRFYNFRRVLQVSRITSALYASALYSTLMQLILPHMVLIRYLPGWKLEANVAFVEYLRKHNPTTDFKPSKPHTSVGRRDLRWKNEIYYYYDGPDDDDVVEDADGTEDDTEAIYAVDSAKISSSSTSSAPSDEHSASSSSTSLATATS